MEIYKSLEELNIQEKTSAALGNFDGIHIGHRVIMDGALKTAKKRGLRSLCFTFSNHPFNFIMQREDDDPHALKLICSEDEKIRIIEGLGFDILVNIPFDEHIMTMRAREFFESILVSRLNAGHISVGFNYSYGARAEGKPDMLKAECDKAGIGICVHDAVMADGKVVSSTLIRETLKEGRMEQVAGYLGRPYAICGKVMHGQKIGSAMGIPTINIPAPDKLLMPPDGVYFSRAVIDGRKYGSVSNLGFKPTITALGNSERGEEEKHRTLETNIFDFDSDAYGKEVCISLDHFSRPEMVFESREALFEQIGKDCENSREYHENAD